MERYAALRSSALVKCQSSNSESKGYAALLTDGALNFSDASVSKWKEMPPQANHAADKNQNKNSSSELQPPVCNLLKKQANVIVFCTKESLKCQHLSPSWRMPNSWKSHHLSTLLVMHHIKTACMPAPPLSRCPLCIPPLSCISSLRWFFILDTSPVQQILIFPPCCFRFLRPPTVSLLCFMLCFAASKRWRQTEATSNCAKKEWKFVCAVVGACVCVCVCQCQCN